jgi:hypothetical protein
MLFAQNKSIFVNVMMLHELGMVVNDTPSWQIGVVHFFAFVTFGMLPVIPYIIADAIKSQSSMLLPSIMIGLAEFISLGIIKTRVIMQGNIIISVLIKSILEITILGSSIVAVGYGVGLIFN